MQKKIAALAVALLTAGGALVASAPATATADGPDVCVPAAAWTETVVVEEARTETVEHPAVGEPTIPNPDYVPATEAQGEPTIPNPDYQPPRTETVVVTPAVPEVPEESHTDYTYEKHVWVLTWVGTGKTSVHHNDKGAYYAEGVVRWIKVGEAKHVTREYVPPVDAVTEEREIPAVGEPTIPNPDYVPAKEAQGEPTIANPDYVPPRTETVEHPAVTEQVEHQAVQCRDGVSLTVVARCYDAQAGIAFRIDNATGGPLTVKPGPQSSVTWDEVTIEPGGTFSRVDTLHSTTGEAGRVVAAVRNAGGAWTVTGRYSAIECETSTPPTEPEPTEPAPVVPPVTTPPTTGSPAPAPVIVAPTPVAKQAATTAADDVDAAENGETYNALASTGWDADRVVMAAVALLLLGGVLVAARGGFRRKV